MLRKRLKMSKNPKKKEWLKNEHFTEQDKKKRHVA